MDLRHDRNRIRPAAPADVSCRATSLYNSDLASGTSLLEVKVEHRTDSGGRRWLSFIPLYVEERIEEALVLAAITKFFRKIEPAADLRNSF